MSSSVGMMKFHEIPKIEFMFQTTNSVNIHKKTHQKPIIPQRADGRVLQLLHLRLLRHFHQASHPQ